MTLDTESQKTIDAYLATLRKQLRELMDEDARDIVEEIRAHILDKTSGDASPQSIDATLAALGTPQQLAVRYRTDELLQRAQLSRSPAIVLRSILRWATLSFVGLLVFVLSGVGYCVGGILVVIGLLKAFLPGKAGLNIDYDSLVTEDDKPVDRIFIEKLYRRERSSHEKEKGFIFLGIRVHPFIQFGQNVLWCLQFHR